MEVETTLKVLEITLWILDIIIMRDLIITLAIFH